MQINMYDKVLLKDGHYAYIVEIFDNGKAFIADIDKDNDTYTESNVLADIAEVIPTP